MVSWTSKGTIISQEFKNSLLDPIFKNLREQSGHELIPRERGIVRLYKVLRRRGRTALLVDLTVPPSQGAVAIECFGLKTSVTSAHAWLNERTGIPIIPAHCEPLPNGRYRLIFHPKISNTVGMTHQQIAQACWNSFEPYVRKNPAPWLWMYKHWRYRPDMPTGLTRSMQISIDRLKTCFTRRRSMSPSRRSCRDVRYRAVRHGAVGCPTQEGPTLIIRDRPQVGGYSYPIRFVPRYRSSTRLGSSTGSQRQFVAQASFPPCR